jgi:hypothetical protein
MIINYMESATAGQVRLLHKALYSHHQENAVHAWPHSSGHHRAHDGGGKKNPASRKKPDFY